MAHIAFLNWRDTRNPEGGGSEVYVEHMAEGLAAAGHQVTIVCAAHDRAPSREVRNGVTYLRHGSKAGVYLRTFLAVALRRLGHVDLYVDVQNGVPFWARLVTRAPVLMLVHHVHREQWPVVYPGLTGRIGWMLESRVAPRLFRRCPYVAVSQATRAELVELGVDAERVRVVRNGSEPVHAEIDDRAAEPTMIVLGRLVPHKQVEHAVDALAAVRRDLPDARLVIVGDGWWHDELVAYVRRAGLEDAVTFTGFLDDADKHHHLAQAWLMLLPSLKEGWGLVVGEAARHRVPTVAYASAGGTTESVHHGVTGMLADDRHDLIAKARVLMTHDDVREDLGAGAFRSVTSYTWDEAARAFADVVEPLLPPADNN